MHRIAITGGSGRIGRYAIDELLRYGYGVTNIDLVELEGAGCGFRQADLTRYDQTLAALRGHDVAVHLAGQSRPDRDFATGAARFENNTLSTFNVFQAAAELGLNKVVWASSSTVTGDPYNICMPAGVPVTEEHAAQPTTAYALSKVVCENIAQHMNRRHGLTAIGLRFTLVYFEDLNERNNYASIPRLWAKPSIGKFNLWTYLDVRDAVQSIRLALASDIAGIHTFNVTARDSIMRIPNRTLISVNFPGLAIDHDLCDHQSMISCAWAEPLLGYKPEYSWRRKLSRAEA